MPSRFYSALKSSGKSINQTIRNQETTVAGERAWCVRRGRDSGLTQGLGLFEGAGEGVGDVVVHAGATVGGEGLGHGYKAVPLWLCEGGGREAVAVEGEDEACVEVVACSYGADGIYFCNWV